MPISERQFLWLGFGSACLLVAVPALTYLAIGNPFDPFDDRRFSQGSWTAAAEYEHHERRAPMARDLVGNHLSAGMTVADVERLLGPSDGKVEKKDAGGNLLPGEYALEYDLGNWSTYGFDNAFVYVCVDTSGRVIHFEINGY